MDATYSDYFWVNKSDINTDLVKSLLTKERSKYRGNAEVVCMYQETPHQIGMPREWAKNHAWFRDFNIIDETVCPHKPFPEIQFPEGTDYRPWQKKAFPNCTQLIRENNGVLLEAPTGSGKSLGALAIASQFNTPVLVCLHKDDLFKNWKETAQKFFPGISVGHVQQKKWDFDHNIVCASTKTLFSQKDKLPEGFLEHFGLIIFDEAHLYPSNTFFQVLNMFKAQYRFAVSATFRRRDGFIFLCDWCVSKHKYKVEVECHPTKYYQVVRPTTLKDDRHKLFGKVEKTKYLESLCHLSDYNQWIADEADKAVDKGRKVVIVSDRIEQLLQIRAKIHSDSGLYVGSLEGRRLSDDEREDAKDKPVILATYQMIEVGTDIPTLDTIILASPRTDIEQVVGRIRRVLPNKKTAIVVDPILDTPFNRDLAQVRQRQYQKLNILPPTAHVQQQAPSFGKWR